MRVGRLPPPSPSEGWLRSFNDAHALGKTDLINSALLEYDLLQLGPRAREDWTDWLRGEADEDRFNEARARGKTGGGVSVWTEFLRIDVMPFRLPLPSTRR